MKAVCQLDGQITRRTMINIKDKNYKMFCYIISLLKTPLLKGIIDICINYLLLTELNKSYLSRSVARRVISPTVSFIKENISYTLFNTPPPPLYNVPKRGFSL